jgi:hypothetical protein
MQLTRRKLAAALLLPAAAARSQTQSQQQPQDELAGARQRMKDNAAALGKIEIPMSVEPAFQFKA